MEYLRVCLFVCLLVLYSRPHCQTYCGKTQRESGHRVGIGFCKNSFLIRQPICQILAKTAYFWSELMLSGGCRVVHWSREKTGHFRVKQHWGSIVLGWETRMRAPVLLYFSSLSRFQSAAGEIFVKQTLTGPIASAYIKNFGAQLV